MNQHQPLSKILSGWLFREDDKSTLWLSTKKMFLHPEKMFLFEMFLFPNNIPFWNVPRNIIWRGRKKNTVLKLAVFSISKRASKCLQFTVRLPVPTVWVYFEFELRLQVKKCDYSRFMEIESEESFGVKRLDQKIFSCQKFCVWNTTDTVRLKLVFDLLVQLTL